MGADHKLDLTSDVTHLIVGKLDTPKYKYVAKERPDVRVVQRSWVEAVNERWKAYEALDLAALEQEYRVPTLHDLQICITGFEDAAQRQYIARCAEQNGAVYHPDLTKGVTHLLAASPQGKKYQYATQWGIKVVALEWLEESLQRGMALDEELYHPLVQKEDRGKGAWVRKIVPMVSPRKRARDDGLEGTLSEANKKKLRRTASAKLSSQNQTMWGDIVGSVTRFEPDKSAVWGDTSATTNTNGSATHSPRNKKLAEKEKDESFPTVSTVALSPKHPQLPQGLFQDQRVALHGFDQRQVRHAFDATKVLIADHVDRPSSLQKFCLTMAQPCCRI